MNKETENLTFLELMKLIWGWKLPWILIDEKTLKP